MDNKKVVEMTNSGVKRVAIKDVKDTDKIVVYGIDKKCKFVEKIYFDIENIVHYNGIVRLDLVFPCKVKSDDIRKELLKLEDDKVSILERQ